MTMELAEWVDRIFGQASPSDYEALVRRAAICGPDEATLRRLIEVFENPATALKPYSDAVLNQALWDLSSEAFPAVRDLAVAWALRNRFIRSVETLFREFFAARCAPTLGHLSEGCTALNSTCYMWWDFDCWQAAPGPLTRDPCASAMLACMRSILAIDHIACKESALHGLGHWHTAQGSAVESIIDEFLKNERGLPEPLREYAINARRGYVL
jgi:hypothetical protein